MEGFDRPIVWIAGGLDRGYKFDKLVPQIRDHVKAAVLYGETKELLLDAVKQAGIENVSVVDTLAEAVPKAYAYSESGDIVLLSPANASWDQFKTFEERGDQFITEVEHLTHKREEA
ncbi:UDP-N-acetylmuramoylalanine-d-glutamate ligase [Lentilactobacillus kosonis]|uniref:UDP-N-acetylmuramoylalanine--D-glutamate ligase n=1 Tax=Lentilactobacillus kosonis TaxID=2810561 RepID=A0A401FNZ9_9LACO|nr:UDP-N-acetylmuramoylalanine-d-glutamate ligase [Lentilactobacillus kosonis]